MNPPRTEGRRIPSRRRLSGPVVWAVLLAAGVPCRAQAPAAPARAGVPEKNVIIRRIAQHRIAMMQYQWKTRLEVRRGNKVVLTRQEELWFNKDGFFERRVLSQTPEPKKPKKPKKAKKKGDKADLVEEVIRLTRTYLLPSSLGLDETLKKAVATPGTGPDQGRTRIQIESYNQAGDTVVYWLEDSDQRVARLEVETRLDKDRVTIVTDYQKIENGPNVAAHTIVKVPGKNLEIRHESFDYVLRDRDPS